MTARIWIWGIVALLGYLGAALATAWGGLLVVRPLYDGLIPPPPYNWVEPPEDVADDNLVPEPETFTLELTDEGSESGSVATFDGQAIVIFPRETIAAAEDEDEVEITLTPLNPYDIAEPPEDLEFDGNAYRVEVVYASSQEAVDLDREITVVLRYPVHAEVMLRDDANGGAWEVLEADRAPASLQLFADSDRLGAFVPATPPRNGWLDWLPYIAIAVGLAAAGALYLGRVRRRRKTGSRTRSQPRRVR